MNEQVHISSIVVTADPDRLDVVEPAIDALPVAEIALRGPGGKLIVTLETPDESEMVDALTKIQLMPGVVSAALVYHQETNETGLPAGNKEAGSVI
ncbi:MAG: chaperone NapD [Rhizobiaceae bacterium]